MNPIVRIRVVLLVGNCLLSEALNRILRKRSDVLVMDQSLELSNLPVLITKSESDVLLLDSASANILNRQRVTRMRDLNPDVQVLMVGMDVDESVFLTAVRAGVSGYLLNDASAADVIAAIRAVSRGEAVCPPQLCKVLFDSVARSREFIPSVRNIGLRLTRRQQELLPMIARGQTNKEIASYLNLSEQTVKNHIHRMLRKMGANDRLQITEIAGIQDATLSSPLGGLQKAMLP
jgi:DNA-binding NarL/FixJ family response regulator